MQVSMRHSAPRIALDAPAHKVRSVLGTTLFPALLVAACILPSAQAKKADAAASAASQAEDVGPHPVLDRIRASGRIVLAHRES